MRYLFSFLALVLFSIVQAQDHAFSARGGALHRSISFEEANTIKSTGLYAGIQYQFIHFVTSVNLTLASAQGGSESSVYVPLCSKFTLAEKVYLIGGPALDVSLDSEESENMHIGYTLGGSYELTDTLSLDTHYALLFAKASEISQFSLGILYQFN
ncbi:MAG: hypothetical protein FGM16_09385 [Flavobacterium sp.]|nr:hypothetical protein [Flavobacterium sp.]